MATVNNTKKTVIISQVFAIIFFSLGIIGRIFESYNYNILLFKKPVILYLYMICFIISYLIEVLTIIFLIKKTKKKLFLLTYLILIPLIVFHLFTWLIASSTTTSTKLYKYPEFDTAIVIENGYDFFGDYSQIYETKNNILIKKITFIAGTPSPLEDDALFNVEIADNMIIYYYKDDFDNHILILEYNDGHFEEKISE